MQLGVAATYLLFGTITHHYFISHGIVGVVWPSSGIALAALLIGGRRFIWGIFLGSLLLNALSCNSLVAVFGITLANVLEALTGFWLITRPGHVAASIGTLANYLRLIALGGVITSMVGASIGASSLLLAGYFPPGEYFENLSHWWMGDTIGVVLLTPFILAWCQPKLVQLTAMNRLEAGILLGITFIAGQIVFMGWFHAFLSDTPKGYWMFLFTSWAAIRLGTRGATLVLLMTSIQALSGAYQKVGFFAQDFTRADLHNYWAYMLILSIVGMALSTYVNEIKKGLEALKLKDSALNAAANSIVITDRAGRIEWANQAFCQATGYSLDEALGKNSGKLVKSGAHDLAYYKLMWKTILSHKVWHGEIVNRRKDGAQFDEEMTITPISNERGTITHFVAVKQDITGRKYAEKYERFQRHTLEMLAENAQLSDILDAIVRGMEQLNPRMLCSILLLDNEGRHLYHGAAPSLPDFYNAAIDGIEIGMGVGSCGTAAFTGERVIVDDITTHPYWAPYKALAARAGIGSCWSQPIRSSTGQILGTFAIYHHEAHTPAESDISIIEQTARLASIAIEHQRMAEQVRQLAFYDTLTKLPNRRLLNDRLSQTLAANKRSDCYSALIFLDLDNFKPLNDTYGHAVGDLLLSQAADRLKSCVRETDTVARFGGDEFVVMLNELDTDKGESTRQADVVAEKIRAALCAPYLLPIRHEGETDSTIEHLSSASIGVVVFKNHNEDQDNILKWADAAMYQAKEAGRNLIRFYAQER